MMLTAAACRCCFLLVLSNIEICFVGITCAVQGTSIVVTSSERPEISGGDSIMGFIGEPKCANMLPISGR